MQQTHPLPRRLRFGPFELDAHAGELFAHGQRQRLPEQPLALLIALLERPGDLVTREELRQRLWPADTYVDFEHGLNAAVKRLRDVLGDSAGASTYVETIPKRGYRFIVPVEVSDAAVATIATPPFESSPPPADTVAGAPTRSFARPVLWIPAVTVAVLAIVLGTVRWKAAAPRPPRVVPLTTLAGVEDMPTLSPDGRQVALSWSDGTSPSRILIASVASLDVRRLTSGAQPDSAPAWSPDGQWIAFVRGTPGLDARVHVTSPLGATELRVSGLGVRPPLAWSPDSEYVLGSYDWTPDTVQDQPTGIVAVSLLGSTVRTVTPTRAPGFDTAPAISPGGRQLAYVSCRSIITGGCDVYVTDIGADLHAAPGPRQLTHQASPAVRKLAWVRDGTAIVYEQQEASMTFLWRIAADGAHDPERVELAGLGAGAPAAAAAADALAFTRFTVDVDVFALSPDGVSRPIVDSTLADFDARISPDQRHLVFCSERSGNAAEIWVSDADGSNAHRLLHGPNIVQSSPQWSPDGRTIAFDSLSPDGYWHVWTTDAEGGGTTQLTTGTDNQKAPTWSRDGRFLYFSSDRGGHQEIWRMDVSAGVWHQVTHTGGVFALESWEGRSLFVQGAGPTAPVVEWPLSGGNPRTIVPCARAAAFAVAGEGLYYVACGPDFIVRRVDSRGSDRAVALVPHWSGNRWTGGLSVAADGTVLYCRRTLESADVLLIENFR